MATRRLILRCSLSIVALLWTITHSASADGALIEWPVSAGGNGHFYEVVDADVTWHFARSDSASRSYLGVSGNLATLTSAEEQNFVINAFFDPNAAANSTPAYWLGATDSPALYPTASEGEWKWITGEPFVFGAPTGPGPHDSPTDFPHPPWSADNPSNSQKSLDTENSLWLFTGGGGLPETPNWSWNDAEASEQLGPYIVEYALPEPSTLALAGIGALAMFAHGVRRRLRPKDHPPNA